MRIVLVFRRECGFLEVRVKNGREMVWMDGINRIGKMLDSEFCWRLSALRCERC